MQVYCYLDMLEDDELSEQDKESVKRILQVLRVKEAEIVKLNCRVSEFCSEVVKKLNKNQKIDCSEPDFNNIKLEAEYVLENALSSAATSEHYFEIKLASIIIIIRN